MDFLGITLTGWTALVIALSMFVLAGVMFILGTKRSHYAWGILSLASTVWAGGFYVVTLASSPEEAIFWWKIAFIGIIVIPFSFLHFTLEFINNNFFNRFRVFFLSLIYGIAAIFLALNLSTDLIIRDVTFLFNELYYNVPPGPLHPYFTAFYTGLVLYSYYLVYRARKLKLDESFRSQIKYFFLGTGVAFLGGSMDFVLVYGIEVHPIRNLSVILGSFIVGFAILRYKLFNVRIVTAQLLTLVLAAFTFIRLVVSKSYEEIIFNIIILAVTFIVGFYLILSVRREVQQREEIERLAEGLRTANEKLKELDKLKSQFLSIASHDLRAPLTAIRNFMSLLMDGTYGKLPSAAEEGVEHVFDRATAMASSVDSYLNVSRIEQGKMKYDFEPTDLKKVVLDAAGTFKPSIEEKGLKLEVSIPENETFSASLDKVKIQEVFNNLLDNAIKYTPEGSISITLEKDGDIARYTQKDTGIGMDEKTLKNLFGLFAPGEESRRINPKSTGVGLYITKAHVEGHKGTIQAQSDGKGKGSRFIVELPLEV